MRTTVNINAGLLGEAKQIAARSHRSLGSVLEDALRMMIAGAGAGEPVPRHANLPSHGRGGLRPGVDLADRGQIAELIGDDELPRASA